MTTEATNETPEALRVVLQRIEDNADYFTLLGLPRGASDGDVQSAFVQMARVLHPDLPAYRGDLRAEATRAFQALTRARLILTDIERRAEYVSGLPQEPEVPLGNDPNPALAKIHVHRARQLIVRRDWPKAEQSLRLANRLFGEPFDPECRGELAWAILNNHANPEHERMAESRALLDEVADSRSSPAAVAQAHYYLAVWHKLAGDMPKVKAHLDKCLAINEKHVEAQREARLFERRRSTSVQTPAAKPNIEKAPTRSSSSVRRASRSATPIGGQGAEVRKVPLEKKQSLLERLFGGKR
jgi:curved DNA-binding protein CbpA